MHRAALFDAGLLFAGKASGVLLRGWQEPSPFTPAKDKRYCHPDWMQDIVVWLACARDPLYLFGPTGCGKTSCLKQVMCALNYPVHELTAHSRLEFPEMVGHHTVQDGTMHYVYGPLTRAMQEGGCFLLNEIDLLDPSTAAGLNTVLDGYPLVIAENGGELVQPHPMFRFAATANSNGGSDSTGLYQGVLRQNLAFMDRFMLVECAYMAPEQELRVLQSHIGDTLPAETLRGMIRFANAVRRLFMGYDAEDMDAAVEVTCSTRTLIRWALLTGLFQGNFPDPVRHALECALTFRASLPTRMALSELYQRIFSE